MVSFTTACTFYFVHLKAFSREVCSSHPTGKGSIASKGLSIKRKNNVGVGKVSGWGRGVFKVSIVGLGVVLLGTFMLKMFPIP